MQGDLFCFCVQTDRKLRFFKLLWFVQSQFGSACKQVRFPASRNLSLELTALATWNYGEESTQIFLKRPADRKKPCQQTRNNLSKCKRYKSKRYKIIANYPRWQPEISRKEQGEQRKQSSVHSVNTSYKFLTVI